MDFVTSWIPILQTAPPTTLLLFIIIMLLRNERRQRVAAANAGEGTQAEPIVRAIDRMKDAVTGKLDSIALRDAGQDVKMDETLDIVQANSEKLVEIRAKQDEMLRGARR